MLAEGFVGAQAVAAQEGAQGGDVGEVAGWRLAARPMSVRYLGFDLGKEVYIGRIGVGKKGIHVYGGLTRPARWPRRRAGRAGGAVWR